MKKVFLILFVLLSTFCSKKKTKTPEGLYTMEQVAVFMKDIYLLQERIKDLTLDDDSSEVVFKYYEQQLFEKHNMDDSIYKESFKYYMDDVAGLSKVYEIIADSLSLEEKLLNARKYTEDDIE